MEKEIEMDGSQAIDSRAASVEAGMQGEAKEPDKVIENCGDVAAQADAGFDPAAELRAFFKPIAKVDDADHEVGPDGRGDGDGNGGDDSLVIVDNWLLPEEMEQVGDLGGDGDDTGGPSQVKLAHWPWTMRERFLLSKVSQAIKQFRAEFALRLVGRKPIEEPTPESVWKRLGDEALGLAPAGSAPMAGLESSVPMSKVVCSADAGGDRIEVCQCGAKPDKRIDLAAVGIVGGDDNEDDGVAEFKRALAAIKEIANLEAGCRDELDLARRQLDRVQEATHRLSSFAMKSARACRH